MRWRAVIPTEWKIQFLIRHFKESVRYFDAEIRFHNDPDRMILAVLAKKELFYSPRTTNGDVIHSLRKAYGVLKRRLRENGLNEPPFNWGGIHGPNVDFRGLVGNGGGQDSI